jgi:hypothetical protein
MGDDQVKGAGVYSIEQKTQSGEAFDPENDALMAGHLTNVTIINIRWPSSSRWPTTGLIIAGEVFTP